MLDGGYNDENKILFRKILIWLSDISSTSAINYNCNNGALE